MRRNRRAWVLRVVRRGLPRHLRRRHLWRRLERHRGGELSRQGGQGVTGLFYGDKNQFICQLIGATVGALWAFGATLLVFKAVNAVNSMRVSEEDEFEGLDEPEFGALAYPEDPRAIPGT